MKAQGLNQVRPSLTCYEGQITSNTCVNASQSFFSLCDKHLSSVSRRFVYRETTVHFLNIASYNRPGPSYDQLNDGHYFLNYSSMQEWKKKPL